MSEHVPPTPKNSIRITITLDHPEDRLDKILMQVLKDQTDHPHLKELSRGGLKNLFAKNRVMIKGQNAKPSSGLAKGITYVDILNG